MNNWKFTWKQDYSQRIFEHYKDSNSLNTENQMVKQNTIINHVENNLNITQNSKHVKEKGN